MRDDVGGRRQAGGVLRALAVLSVAVALALPGSAAASPRALIALRDGRHWAPTQNPVALATPTAPSAAASLPRTGGAPGLVALAGVGLLLLGTGLRERTRTP
jgi:hypothetical protein